MGGVTPIYSLPYPSLTDAPNGPAQIQSLAEEVETELARIDSGLNTNTANIATNTTTLARLGIVAWGNRTSPSSTVTTTITGVLRIDDIPVSSGTSYVVEATNVILDSTVTGDGLQADIRFTTDGSTPVTGSPPLPGSIIYGRIITANSGESKVIRCVYVPPSNQTLSILLCVQRIGGTGNARLFAGTNDRLELGIYKVGPGVTNVGTSV